MVEYGWGTLGSWAGCERFPRQVAEWNTHSGNEGDGRGRGGFLGQPAMLSHWSRSIPMGGWENKTGQVGQVWRCKSTSGCRETGRGKVNVWGWRNKEEGGFAWGRREASGFCWASTESAKGTGEQRCQWGTRLLSVSKRLLFCWTSQLFLTGYLGIETAHGLLLCLIPRTAEKRKLHKSSGFPQTSKSCFSKWTRAQRSLTATSLS